jgi:hypothetical protein
MTTLLLLFANAVRQKVVRKKTIGLGLERLIKRGNKMPIQVAEGKKRPDVPLQAAKLASETGVALRDQLPIYTSWKQYQKEAGPAEVQKVLDKVAVRQLFHSAYFLELVWFPCTKLCLINHLWMQTRLDVEVEREGPAKAACTDIVKKGVRQQRYHLKRKYFDPSLTLEQMLAKPPPPKMKKAEWTKLVEYWCDPRNQVHALHHLFFLKCSLNYVHDNENFVLLLWCRRNVKRIK